jgi:hypothetical protein
MCYLILTINVVRENELGSFISRNFTQGKMDNEGNGSSITEMLTEGAEIG